jgi:hypothetical protein
MSSDDFNWVLIFVEEGSMKKKIWGGVWGEKKEKKWLVGNHNVIDSVDNIRVR